MALEATGWSRADLKAVNEVDRVACISPNPDEICKAYVGLIHSSPIKAHLTAGSHPRPLLRRSCVTAQEGDQPTERSVRGQFSFRCSGVCTWQARRCPVHVHACWCPVHSRQTQSLGV